MDKDMFRQIMETYLEGTDSRQEDGDHYMRIESHYEEGRECFEDGPTFHFYFDMKCYVFLSFEEMYDFFNVFEQFKKRAGL